MAFQLHPGFFLSYTR